MSNQAVMLFPVRLVGFEALRDWECFDADTGKDSAREIREYFISDFSNWKDQDSYEQAFDRLLRDLKAKSDGAGDTRLTGRSESPSHSGVSKGAERIE